MLLFLSLMGFLALFSALTLMKAGHSARHGRVDQASFHYCEEVLIAQRTTRAMPVERSDSLAKTAPKQAA
jgi:hypothetical protein